MIGNDGWAEILLVHLIQILLLQIEFFGDGGTGVEEIFIEALVSLVIGWIEDDGLGRVGGEEEGAPEGWVFECIMELMGFGIEDEVVRGLVGHLLFVSINIFQLFHLNKDICIQRALVTHGSPNNNAPYH